MIRKPTLFDHRFGLMEGYADVKLEAAVESDPREKRDETIRRQHLINQGDPLSLLLKED
jgi:hypothetical protein